MFPYMDSGTSISIYGLGHAHLTMYGLGHSPLPCIDQGTPTIPSIDSDTPSFPYKAQACFHFYVWIQTNPYLHTLRLGHAHVSKYGFRHSWISTYGFTCPHFHMWKWTHPHFHIWTGTRPLRPVIKALPGGETEARYRIGVFLFCIFYNLMI